MAARGGVPNASLAPSAPSPAPSAPGRSGCGPRRGDGGDAGRAGPGRPAPPPPDAAVRPGRLPGAGGRRSGPRRWVCSTSAIRSAIPVPPAPVPSSGANRGAARALEPAVAALAEPGPPATGVHRHIPSSDGLGSGFHSPQQWTGAADAPARASATAAGADPNHRRDLRQQPCGGRSLTDRLPVDTAPTRLPELISQRGSCILTRGGRSGFSFRRRSAAAATATYTRSG
jgi:hypothetical protein